MTERNVPIASSPVWRCRGIELPLATPLVMGILNVTPDSFSDGGRFASVDAALRHADAMREAGASIVDVGGESTRPGAASVSEAEELHRVVPVVEKLVREGFLVSVDTSKPAVMRAVMDVGAHIINDVRALTTPGAMEAVAAGDLGVVLMHSRGTPDSMRAMTTYDDVVGDVSDYLRERTRRLLQLGVDNRRICWDPGFGFAKTAEQSWTLLERLDEIVKEGFPVLAGLSRKSMIGSRTGISNPSERDAASVEAAMDAVRRGAKILRVHNVGATTAALASLQ